MTFENGSKWRAMFGKKYKIIIVVHNDTVCWIDNGATNQRRQSFQVPLDQVLSSDKAMPKMPDWLKGSQKTLCIIPDHWFGSQSYPFRSKKPSLIESFLERKLAAVQPGQKAIRHFFNYRHSGDDREPQLDALFFQEDKSYQLYTALSKLNHTPQHITAPAFLWEERLRQTESDFYQLGTLLIHLTDKECQLYFYFKGNYQFSRSVMLFETGDDLDALGFEINQSLYMFSQKAKSELDRIYMICEASQCQSALGDVLGREIVGLEALAVQDIDATIIPEMATLIGLLQDAQLGSGVRFFSVMHRQVKQAMAWRPVQWSGIFVGLLLVIGLSGEHFILRKMLKQARHEYQTIQQVSLENTSGPILSEYPATLDQVLNMARRSLQVGTAHRMSVGFPSRIQLKTLELELESSPSMKVTALVQAADADELHAILKRLIAQLKTNFKDTGALTLNDIDISLNRSRGVQPSNRYQIGFELELS
jgi:hypothetical protein